MVCRNCIATAEVRTLVELSLADKNSNPSIRRHVGYGVVKISGWSVIADTAGQNRFTICRPDQADRRSGTCPTCRNGAPPDPACPKSILDKALFRLSCQTPDVGLHGVSRDLPQRIIRPRDGKFSFAARLLASKEERFLKHRTRYVLHGNSQLAASSDR